MKPLQPMGDRHFIQSTLLSDWTFGMTYVMGTRDHPSVILRVSVLTAETLPQAKEDLEKMKQLKHQNILRLLAYDFDQDNKTVFLVSEHCTTTLHKPYVESDQVIKMCVQMACGLEFLHSKNILHRDLRPSNIFKTRDGHIKLGHLGFNREQETTALKASYCPQTVQSLASVPCYMGPEMFKVNGTYTTKTDIWSLGCIFYEILAGRPAFVYSCLYALQNEKPQTIWTFSHSDLKGHIKSMMSKKPDERPTAKEVLSWMTILYKKEGHKDMKISNTDPPAPPTIYWGTVAQIVRDAAKPVQDPTKSNWSCSVL